MSKRGSALVVGGGLIGCSAAYYLAERGWQVHLLERDHLGAGASTGNCGYVCPSHVMPLAMPGAVGRTLRTMLGADSPVAVRWRADPALFSWLTRFALQCRRGPMLRAAEGRHALLVSAMQLYRGLLDQGRLDCQWHDAGLMMVYRSRKEFDAFAPMADQLQRDYEVKVTPYADDALLQYEPTLKPGLAGGWHHPGDAHVNPAQLLSSLRRLLVERDVIIEEGVTVESLDITGGKLRQLRTTQGLRSADSVVLATGAETPAFAKPLGCRIPIQPGKGYSLTLPANGTPLPQVPLIFEESHVAVTPWEATLRVGSTMEFAGYDRTANPSRVSLLMRSAREHLRAVPSDAGIEPWVGWRPMVYDGLPCIDRTPAASNAFVAAGNGMIGLATAPATGKLVAELATGETPHIDPAPYSMRRF